MSSPRSDNVFPKYYLWWQVNRSYVKWGVASFCCYGNSDLGEMNPILNFYLSLAHHLSYPGFQRIFFF